MSTLDWPTSRYFMGATFSLMLDVSESAYTGFLTGNRTKTSNLADRLRAMLTLPPVLESQAGAARESFLMGVRSGGHYIRHGMPHRKMPAGTLRGSPTVASNAAAGARSFSIEGATSLANLLQGSGFEVDGNSDGLADGWTAYGGGSNGTVTYSRVAGLYSTWAQQVQASAWGSTSSDQVGVRQTSAVTVSAGSSYTFAADAADSGLTMRLYIGWYTGAMSFVSASQQSFATSSGGWLRRSLTATCPVGASKALCYVWGESAAGGPVAANFYCDNVQFERGSSGTTYAAYPTLMGGDWLGINGNLHQVAYAGANLNDIGAGTVTLSLPLPKALTAGAAVSWSAPTGVWELDDDGLQLDYSAGIVQAGIAIPLRQVVL